MKFALLTQLKYYDVHSTPQRWISCYLSNKEHIVSWSQIQSTSLNLNIDGWLQGSILGPLNWKDHISMISPKKSKLCGIILYIEFVLLYISNLKNEFTTVSFNHILDLVCEFFNRLHMKIVCGAQKRSVCALFSITQQPQSRYIFLHQKFSLRVKISYSIRHLVVLSN